jgi:hypothetical protein
MSNTKSRTDEKIELITDRLLSTYFNNEGGMADRVYGYGNVTDALFCIARAIFAVAKAIDDRPFGD